MTTFASTLGARITAPGVTNLLATLILGHLIADFPLQVNWVYRLKSRYWWGVVLHAAIHCVITAMLLERPLAYWPVLVVLGLAHFATDWVKLRVDFKVQCHGFVLDQIAHAVALLLLATWQPEMMGVLAPRVLYPAVGYALVPALLIFVCILATDLEQIAFCSSSSLESVIVKLIALSQVTGLPLVIGAVVVRFGVLC